MIIFILIYFFNNFSNKPIKSKKYILDNKDYFEVLIMGSSHAYVGVNPDFLSFKSINLAYNDRHLKNDISILNKFLDEFPKVKAIIMPSDYFTLWHDSNENEHNSITKAHFDINMSLFDWILHPQLCRLNCLRGEEKSGNGFRPNHKKLSEYDSIKINKMIINRINTFHTDMLSNNINKVSSDLLLSLENLVQRCQKKNVILLFVEYPVIKSLREKYKDSLKKINLINYAHKRNWKNLNLNQYKFNDSLFNDVDHLNFDGAKKASKIIDSVLIKLLKQSY